ncbi:hypothetical protein SLS55_000962 [Diplodia seriata]|uniref:Uncharacterized protein n=1 Tax=Diplodia seriata TaxID=420778 RepID=A0ABR3CVU2_9PEZI
MRRFFFVAVLAGVACATPPSSVIVNTPPPLSPIQPPPSSSAVSIVSSQAYSVETHPTSSGIITPSVSQGSSSLYVTYPTTPVTIDTIIPPSSKSIGSSSSASSVSSGSSISAASSSLPTKEPPKPSTTDVTIYTTVTTCPVTKTMTDDKSSTYITTQLTTSTMTITSCKGGCSQTPTPSAGTSKIATTSYYTTTVVTTVLTTVPCSTATGHDGTKTLYSTWMTESHVPTTVISTVTSVSTANSKPPASAPPSSAPPAQPSSKHETVSATGVDTCKPTTVYVTLPMATTTVSVGLGVPVSFTAPASSSPIKPSSAASSKPSQPSSATTKASASSTQAVPSASASCNACQQQENACRSTGSPVISFCSAQRAFCDATVASGFTYGTDCTAIDNACRSSGDPNLAFCNAQLSNCQTGNKSSFGAAPACPKPSGTSSSAVVPSASSSSISIKPSTTSSSAPASTTTAAAAATCSDAKNKCLGSGDPNLAACNAQAAECCEKAYDSCRSTGSPNQAYCSAERANCFGSVGLGSLLSTSSSSSAFRGNQLAIVTLPDADFISKSRKQQIAREFNFSETVFLHRRSSDPSSSWAIDIYTPEAEMVFAGHPVIGTGHYLFSLLKGLPPLASSPGTEENAARNELVLHTRAGPVSLRHDPATRLVSASIPHDVHEHHRAAPTTSWHQLLATQPPALRTLVERGDPENLQTTTFPTVSIVNGVTYVLCDLTAHPPDVFAAVRAGPSPEVSLDDGWAPGFVGVMYYRVLDDGVGAGDDVVRLRVRMVAIGLEDPACGSGASALCAWLALQRGRGRGGARVRFELEEGTEIGRQSFIGVEVVLNRGGDGVQEVWLMGKAAWVTKGEFFGV